CEMDTADDQWLVFQRRIDGSVDFYRGWQSYAQGFGDLQAEFWLGNEMLHALTASGFTVLRVDVADFDDVTAYAEYQRFTVGDANDNYRMFCSDYSGTAGDSLAVSNGAQFTTSDADHDISHSANCAVRHHGAFWYVSCSNASPNGLYLGGEYSGDIRGVIWLGFKGSRYSLKSIQMKLRKK
ncbi:hypothetical protein CAPTEDRAFT_146055, partial [Capitella teleta]